MSRDTFVMSVGQAHEFALACAQAGFTAALVKKLSSTVLLIDVRRVVEGRALIVDNELFVDPSADPVIPNGWQSARHKLGESFSWSPEKVHLHVFEEQCSDSGLSGEAIQIRLDTMPTANANLLDFLLDRRHLIPEFWRNFKVIFWGTKYRDSAGELCVRCLQSYEGVWGWITIHIDKAPLGDEYVALILSE